MRRIIAPTAAVTLLLAGCVAAPDQPLEEFVAVFEMGEVHPQALIQGTLEFLPSGCLGLTGPGSASTMLVLPAGSTHSDGVVHIEGYGDVPLGSIVRGGGGYASPADPSVRDTLPEPCADLDAAYLYVVESVD